MAKKRKKKKIDIKDFSRLDQQSVDFITAKVKELGSQEAVARFYNRNDTVSEFAKTIAKVYFGSIDV